MSSHTTHRTWVSVGLLLGMSLAAIEVTVVATAMPRIVGELGGQHLYSLPYAFYMLLATVSGPLWGYFSDRYGRRRYYLIAIALFLAGSAACGAAQSMVWLILARAFQGLGGGGTQTLTFTLIGELYPLKERAKIQGYISAVWGVSALVGPLVGGFIVDNTSWRWVFYLNIPFGIAGAAVVARHYVSEGMKAGGSFDWLGAAVFTGGATLLVYGLQTHATMLLMLGIGVLVGFIVLERRAKVPFIPLNLLGDSFIGASVLGNFLGGTAFFGLTGYLPLFIQEARGQSATLSGTILAPTTFGWTIASVLVARILTRVRPRRLAFVGGICMTLSFSLLTVALSGPLWTIGASGFVVGLGMGTTMLVFLVGAQEVVPRDVLGSATATLMFSRNIGGSIGSALMGALLATGLSAGGEQLAADFWRATFFAALMALGVLLLSIRLPEVTLERR